MLQIDTDIANKIVDRTMKIIGHNINVMNAQAVILGSGEKHRIGSIHEGALLAISQNRNVEISHAIASTLQGVKPGLNLPLHYQGQVVGAIGITGEPESLSHYGELLKMTAEMIVEQANLQEQLQWQNRQKEEFISQFIVASEAELPSLKQWALQLGIDLSMPRVAAIIELDNNNPTFRQDNQALKQVMYLLQHPMRDNLIAMTSLTQLVILKPAFLDGKQFDPELESQRIDKLLKRLPANMQLSLHISLGHYFSGDLGITHSYRTAKETLDIGKKYHPHKSKYLYQDYSLQVLLSGLRHHWRGNALAGPYQKLIAADNNQQLQKTLAAYLEHLGDLQACAKSLFIHRNTLRYRLDKIQSITNVDLHNFNGLLSLYLGQLIHQPE
ncbi:MULTISPECIES: sugar diacid recognition domain-containing protein [Shewanella]|uniref:Sugar diacid recognition domain-containing protein n=1 Tax=Shewanella metallivivens TaxID=2872342 RepID=A0ABT5TKR7_9GAMM|nr:sugar diacid recognition domain-containing protein [Shewanella metallivivens]MDD8059197.1 sugar diacid recognition domain-containing protein [Shewanella metallivivens]